MTRLVYLGVLGTRTVTPAPGEEGHYLWLNPLGGWTDCTAYEDTLCG